MLHCSQALIWSCRRDGARSLLGDDSETGVYMKLLNSVLTQSSPSAEDIRKVLNNHAPSAVLQPFQDTLRIISAAIESVTVSVVNAVKGRSVLLHGNI